MATSQKAEQVRGILPRVEGVDRRAIPRDHQGITKEQEIEFFIAQANEARRDFEDAKREFRDLAHEEDRLEATRPILLETIKLQLMENQPSLAATPADKLARCDQAYLNHLALQRDAVRRKDDALTRAESAKMRQETAVAACRAIGGWI